MAKIIFIISILIFLIVAGFFFFQKNMFFQDKLKVKEGKVCFSAFGGKDICFDVELALNKQEQIQGLMFRKSLDKNKGMFFSCDISEISWMFLIETGCPPPVLLVMVR